MFTTTFTHRDDWLHRGIMLRDMDYYHYARYMQRVEMPRLGSAANFQKKHGAYFLFDTHYPLARSYVQILRKKPCTVQNVGPHCKRSEVNGGEDNAVYQLDVPVGNCSPAASQKIRNSIALTQIDNKSRFSQFRSTRGMDFHEIQSSGSMDFMQINFSEPWIS